jgi:hypothetical protein
MKDKMPDEVLIEWTSIWNSVANLHGMCQAFDSLFGSESHVKRMQTLLPELFAMIQEGLRAGIVMAHGRLLDPAEIGGKENISFYRLLDTLGGHCESAFVHGLRMQLDEAKAHCEPMLRWRNKRIGHSDRKTLLSPHTDKMPNIDREEIKKGLEMLASIVDAIDMYFDGGTTYFGDVLLRGNGSDLMALLEAGLDARDRERFGRFADDIKALRRQGQGGQSDKPI